MQEDGERFREMAAIVCHDIVQAAGRIALKFRVFAQVDQQPANLRHMVALQGREGKDVVAFIAIRQRPARAEIGLEPFVCWGKNLQILVLRRSAVGHRFQAGEGSFQSFCSLGVVNRLRGAGG